MRKDEGDGRIPVEDTGRVVLTSDNKEGPGRSLVVKNNYKTLHNSDQRRISSINNRIASEQEVTKPRNNGIQDKLEHE